MDNNTSMKRKEKVESPQKDLTIQDLSSPQPTNAGTKSSLQYLFEITNTTILDSYCLAEESYDSDEEQLKNMHESLFDGRSPYFLRVRSRDSSTKGNNFYTLQRICIGDCTGDSIPTL
jgi:hypothetical protein